MTSLEIDPKDLSGNLIMQLGVVTEDPNRPGVRAGITDIHRNLGRAAFPRMEATVDGRVQRSSCCPGISRRQPRPKKHMPMLPHNMTVTAATLALALCPFSLAQVHYGKAMWAKGPFALRRLLDAHFLALAPGG